MPELYGDYKKPHNYEQYLEVQDLIKHSFIPTREFTKEQILEDNLVRILEPQSYYEYFEDDNFYYKGANFAAFMMMVDEIEVANELQKRAMLGGFNKYMKSGKLDEAFFLGLHLFDPEKDKQKEPLFIEPIIKSINNRFEKKDLFGAGLRLAVINNILANYKDIHIDNRVSVDEAKNAKEKEIVKILKSLNQDQNIKYIDNSSKDKLKRTNVLGIPDEHVREIILYLVGRCLQDNEQGNYVDSFVISSILKDIIPNDDPINQIYDALKIKVGDRDIEQLSELSSYTKEINNFYSADDILNFPDYLSFMLGEEYYD